MHRAQGYALIIDPIEGTKECDTFTCAHCQRVVHVNPKAHPDEFGSMCRNCMAMVCRECASKPCSPFLKEIEKAEAKAAALRSYEI